MASTKKAEPAKAEAPAPAKSHSAAPFNVCKVDGEVQGENAKITIGPIEEQFTTAYEAHVYLRDVLKMKGKVLNQKGEDITASVIPKADKEAGSSK